MDHVSLYIAYPEIAVGVNCKTTGIWDEVDSYIVDHCAVVIVALQGNAGVFRGNPYKVVCSDHCYVAGGAEACEICIAYHGGNIGKGVAVNSVLVSAAEIEVVAVGA